MARRKRTIEKQRSTKNITQKTKDRATRTPIKTGDELGCSRRVNSSCSTCDNRCVTVKWHEHHVIWKSCHIPLTILNVIIFILCTTKVVICIILFPYKRVYGAKPNLNTIWRTRPSKDNRETMVYFESKFNCQFHISSFVPSWKNAFQHGVFQWTVWKIRWEMHEDTEEVIWNRNSQKDKQWPNEKWQREKQLSTKHCTDPTEKMGLNSRALEG